MEDAVFTANKLVYVHQVQLFRGWRPVKHVIAHLSNGLPRPAGVVHMRRRYSRLLHIKKIKRYWAINFDSDASLLGLATDVSPSKFITNSQLFSLFPYAKSVLHIQSNKLFRSRRHVSDLNFESIYHTFGSVFYYSRSKRMLGFVDNRNSSAAKRARTDGGRREDDWTCPSCGNVNFSFRTTCNMRNCTQPRPADHSFKSAPKAMQAPQGYGSVASFGSPSSMYLPSYGSSLLNGSTVPPYDVGSAYHYNYGTRVSGGSPYRPLQISAPSPYSGGSLIGGMYGIPQLLDRYGLGLPMGHSSMAPRPGFFPEEKGHKKDGKGDNDWTCPNCGNNNFSFRTVCNMRKCNTPKPGPQAGKSSNSFKSDTPDGSWKCNQCNNINYPFRTKCNRQNCGAEKPTDSQKSPSEEAAEENVQVFSGQFNLTDSFQHVPDRQI
ncbi:hypothetical protein R6Q57_019998 [Mikania cordata]